MNEESFLIQFIASKNCFLQFSNKWLQKLSSPKCSCLRVVHPVTKKELRFTWSPKLNYSLNDCSVGINATFANSLDLHENELVVISSEERIVQLTQVFLIPFSSDDYEILEMSQNNVEQSLLNQIRVVNIQQTIIIWVSRTVHLKLTVDRITPDMLYGRLQVMTELVIENVNKTESHRVSSTFVNNSLQDSVNHTEQTQQKNQSSLWGLLSPFDVSNESTPSDTVQSQNSLWLTSRVHPYPNIDGQVDCCNRTHNGSVHPYNVFMCRKTLQKKVLSNKTLTFLDYLFSFHQCAIVCRLENIPQPRSKVSNNKTSNYEKVKMEIPDDDKKTVSVCVRLYRIEDSCKFFKIFRTKVPCVYVSQYLREILGSKVGSRVRLTDFKPLLHKVPTSITLVTSAELSENEAEELIDQFSARLQGRDGVLVNNHFPLNLDPPVVIHLSPSDLPCWPLTRPQLKGCPLTVATDGETDLTWLTQQHHDDSPVQSVVSSVFQELVKEGMTTVDFTLGLTEDQYQDRLMDNILITGKRGSGKSRLAKAIYSRVSGPPHHVHVSIINCKSLKGKKPETIGKVVSDYLTECVYYGPALLVLEDLPSIAGTLPGDQELSQEAGYYLKVATMIKELIWNQSLVSILATAESRQHVHAHLLSARGRHTFTTFLHIPPLCKLEREHLLSELVRTRACTSHSPTSLLTDAASRTEGCVARDLCRLVDRAFFNMCKRNAQEVSLCAEDLDAALHGFVPEGLSNISLTHHSPHSFSSIGGLLQAKQLLTEVLIWPSKYQEVFSQCPLRLERGVLLYGAPGTGKTLLASAVAGECGLNFITVKGPELLSKYIGASEEAVRNIFQKAQSAQPCILFFDEFDSLAPRRGHDSTGVTDRVVNQLLTQMDGVEALEGVWVVAAASRPDLLDPALLRPGRIGTLVHCPLPNQEERLAILKSLGCNLELSGDCDLAVIAADTEGFTGADLQALLFTAQMAAYDSTHPDSDDELEIAAPPVTNVVVCQAHLLTALKETSPSLKAQDRQRFQNIYKEFLKSREGGESFSKEQAQRVTLA